MPENDWIATASPTALERRGEIVWNIRQFFHRHGYSEVHTPTISRDTVIDPFIDPIVIRGDAIACAEATDKHYFLQTSPEYCMKRLLASGMRSIYQLGPAYRASERGQFHNPEFTMLEWYRAGETFSQAVNFLTKLTDMLFGQQETPVGPTQVISYQDVFQLQLGLDPLACEDDVLPKIAAREQVTLGSSWDDQTRDDWLNLLFSHCVQPCLGMTQPMIVTHYPASQAALAQVSTDDPRTSERYELFVDGIELANGYHELLDASELAVRSRTALNRRRSEGKVDLSMESRLLEAMRGIP